MLRALEAAVFNHIQVALGGSTGGRQLDRLRHQLANGAS
jgi:hypothetical protein